MSEENENNVLREAAMAACPGHRFVNGRCQRCPMTIDEFNATNPPMPLVKPPAMPMRIEAAPQPEQRICSDCGEPLAAHVHQSITVYNHPPPSKCLHVERLRGGERRIFTHDEIVSARLATASA